MAQSSSGVTPDETTRHRVAAALAPGRSPAERLIELADLRRWGALSDEEYEADRRIILSETGHAA